MSLTVRFNFPVIKKAETFYFGETKDEFRRDFGFGESFPGSPIPPPPTDSPIPPPSTVFRSKY